MPVVEIDIGNAPNDGNGDPLRTSGQKINQNFEFLNDKIDSLKFIPVIDGFATIKNGNPNSVSHEVGDVIAGYFSEGRFIIAKVNALPITDEENLRMILDDINIS
ncbi:hypothetical protein [Aquimarina sp. 2201CG14-23]|uniref:hypothetical protein n=1 Tax=Aquimarina mycalae TaxID=3040073 RepID=UPI0024780937|nr:hypothetical protein [Aquimarina sp. 2201CG14-23]MDH7444683.1 hypothetical protein [Aquimarina sp. 2201CG14-23]